MRGWGELVRELGEAFLALLRAEAEALVEDFGRSGRALARALMLAAAAGAVAFWALGLALYVTVELLALVLPRWGAAAVAFGALVLAAAALALVARAKLRSIEAPVATVRRRAADNRRWWTERIAADSGAEGGGDEPPGAGGREPAEIEEELP